MKKFLYRGPIDSSVTLRLEDGKELDVMFYRGKETVPLPEEHDYVKTMVALKHLVPVTETAQAETSVLAKGSKAGANKDGGE